ncbi:MAG: phage head closure protein [Pseudomonadales bacterium]|nr:phage head closure protein [Pseudomonadales bacterium]
MGAGGRNRRLTFEKLSETKDSAGGLIQTYTKDFNRWASLRGVTGNEKYISEQLVSLVSHKIIVLRDSKTKGLNNNYRATYSGRIFDIKAVINIREENKELLILADEVIT